MKAYKFRSAAQADRIFDILLNQRLYCSRWSNLNDPMEGVFGHVSRAGQHDDAQLLSEKIRSETNNYRVCSLAGTFDCHLLWAHYADGFNGVAIEVDLPDDDPLIGNVEYRGVFAFVHYEPTISPEDAARSVLLSKYQEWRYEQEVRILSKDKWYQLRTPIRRVIAGQRLSAAMFDAIQLVCESQGIEFRSVGIGDEGIDADRVSPLAERRKRRASSL